MFLAGAPRRSASLEVDTGDGEPPYPPTVGLFGSFAANLALPPAAALPLPCDDMLSLRGRLAVVSANSCGCDAPGVACWRVRSSGYGSGRGPEGGGEVGAPNALGGTRYRAHCC